MQLIDFDESQEQQKMQYFQPGYAVQPDVAFLLSWARTWELLSWLVSFSWLREDLLASVQG